MTCRAGLFRGELGDIIPYTFTEGIDNYPDVKTTLDGGTGIMSKQNILDLTPGLILNIMATLEELDMVLPVILV